MNTEPVITPEPPSQNYVDSGVTLIGKSMSNTQGNIAIVLLVAIMAVASWATFRPITKWEYKVEAIPDSIFTTGMSKLGDDGWELVAARRASSGEGASATVSYEMIFKRPKR